MKKNLSIVRLFDILIIIGTIPPTSYIKSNSNRNYELKTFKTDTYGGVVEPVSILDAAERNRIKMQERMEERMESSTRNPDAVDESRIQIAVDNDESCIHHVFGKEASGPVEDLENVCNLYNDPTSANYTYDYSVDTGANFDCSADTGGGCDYSADTGGGYGGDFGVCCD